MEGSRSGGLAPQCWKAHQLAPDRVHQRCRDGGTGPAPVEAGRQGVDPDMADVEHGRGRGKRAAPTLRGRGDTEEIAPVKAARLRFRSTPTKSIRTPMAI